ncbi:pickpocket protein 28-like [Phlebotomus argentipes]|uniref:pickpocket protein 28-like n=1 Tax=Phlebotomus argentipes TaxID=94469 RepID=UPI0028934885|nr:pickpocket protein 28-like [Phlebotomus argentipes]
MIDYSRKSHRGDSWMKPRKSPVKFKKIKAKHVFREYCEKSSVHGVKYFAEKDRPVWERVLWIALFVLSLFACGKMIERAWTKLNNSPLAVTFAEKAVHITQIPFPALTICSTVKFRSESFSFAKYTANPDKYKQWREIYRNLGQLCETYDPLPGNLDDNILDTVRRFSPNEDDMIKTVTFCDDKLNTAESFYESFTSQGLCYTFNRLPLENIYKPDCIFSQQNESSPLNVQVNWSVETGFADHHEFYPRRVSNIRQESGLSLILQIPKKDVDTACMNTVGYQLQFHSPSDIPQMDEHSVFIPVDRFAQIAVEPGLINTPRNIENYPPEQRQCYFNSERQLQHFQIYSERNCKMECLANWTLVFCGCVYFYMPRNSSVPICGPSAKSCLEQSLILIDRPDAVVNFTPPICNCMPGCVSLTYNTDLTHSAIDYDALATVDERFSDPSTKKFHIYVMIYFNENKFYAMQRSELFGQTDFISSVGGFLGLFMGISVLSLVELIYFGTVRWFQLPPGHQKRPITGYKGRQNLFIVNPHHSRHSRYRRAKEAF